MNLLKIKSIERHPLCVDLDGTLVKTDTLVEAVFALLRQNFLFVFKMAFWLLKGRLHFKMQVFEHGNIDASLLPYNREVLDLINNERARGRAIVLATASPHKIAESVSRHLGIFSSVLASDEKLNLKGKAKAALLVDRFGEKGFDYVGDSRHDLQVWSKAERSYLVNASLLLEKRARQQSRVIRNIYREGSKWRPILRQIRVHQWAKNILVFIPMLLSEGITNGGMWLSSMHAFFAFSLVASSVYVLNDLLDLEADRKHPENKKRPFASGDLPLTLGFTLFPSLIFLGFSVASLLSAEFTLVLAAYLAFTTAYSFKLKKVALADILLLASLYSWRVVAGAVACQILISEWFFIFSSFFFLSLALVKRSAELILFKKTKGKANARRAYTVEDLPVLTAFGVSSGFLSILVLALFLSTPEIKLNYKEPLILWAILPLALYWVTSVWLKTLRGEIPSDPLVYAIKDRLSYLLGFSMMLIWMFAKGVIPAF